MPKKGKILSLPSATWFPSLCGVRWGLGTMSRSPPCPLVAASFHGPNGGVGGGQIQGDDCQGDGEWEFVPHHAENPAGMNAQGNTQRQTGIAGS